MTQKEQVRLQVLNGVLGDQVSKGQAAEILGVSERHVWRILADYRKEGAVALAHRNRGRRPSNATSEATMAEVVALARTRYTGANHTHLTELLAEREGISLSRSVVRRILVGAGVASPRRRRPPRHRVRRQRMPQEGMLVQIDASHHPWLEERGPRFALLLAVDDATSTVPYALFRQVEDTFGYFLLMEGMARRAGIPLALYSDRHAVFQHQREPRQAPAGPTQFGRAMQELGVQQIFARSPQAKGRVERTAGTFQDRLVTELRLAGATTIEKANQVLWNFLPRFNERFGVPPQQPGIAYRPAEPGMPLDRILCFKHIRKVARDNTVKYSWRTLQLLPGKERPSYAGVHVEVQELLDGQLLVRCQDRTIPTQEAPPRPGVLRALNGALAHGPSLVNGVSHFRLERHQQQRLAALEAVGVDEAMADGTARNGTSRVRKPAAAPRRKLTPRQRARWKAVQAAKLQGLSLRAIARELGIHRETVRKYVDANSPPVYRRGVKANTS
ncbi:MAG: ISNCY family transposase [Chloroflexi bacterium]|nr:ISNCY family transposase [Chloroflexota bacterium]